MTGTGREAVIVEAVRTPVGKRGGALADWHPTDLLALTLRTLVDRSGLNPERLDDVIAGCAITQGEQGTNLARYAVLAAGFPVSVPATTIDRQCGSGQQSVHFAAQGIRSGEYDFAVGAGVELMSRVDIGPIFDASRGNPPMWGSALDRYGLMTQGNSCELLVKQYGFTRAELDEFSAESHRRAHAATEAGYFKDQLVPVEGLSSDEGIRPDIDPEKMAALRPAFSHDGTITAGNSSQISDGAAALLVAERSAAEAAGLKPRAVIRSMAIAGADPVLQFTAVVPAARKALERAGLTIDDMDLVEVNEAFSPVPLLVAREMGVGPDRLNVNGGSIAIGHPLGSTGSRLLTQLVYELERRDARYGLLTICEGGGMANATIVERI